MVFCRVPWQCCDQFYDATSMDGDEGPLHIPDSLKTALFAMDAAKDAHKPLTDDTTVITHGGESALAAPAPHGAAGNGYGASHDNDATTPPRAQPATTTAPVVSPVGGEMGAAQGPDMGGSPPARGDSVALITHEELAPVLASPHPCPTRARSPPAAPPTSARRASHACSNSCAVSDEEARKRAEESMRNIITETKEQRAQRALQAEATAAGRNVVKVAVGRRVVVRPDRRGNGEGRD